MENIFYLNSTKRNIDGKEYYCINILDLNNTQIFKFYKLVDVKSSNFVNMHKAFDNISSALTFAIKRNNKISFDIK